MKHSRLTSLLMILAALIAGADGSNTIEWDESTRVLVREHAGYGRMIRLDSGDILAGYSLGEKTWAAVSTDHGKTWQHEVEVGACPWGRSTNSELLQLKDGSIIYFWNDRSHKDSGKPYTIMISTSVDNGKTWSAARQVYAGGTDWGTGCWEPATILLPDGEFKPSIIRTSLKSNWRNGSIDDKNSNRWPALKNPLPAAVYAGEWNALFVKDRQTITAISGTTINGVSGLWTIDGRVK